MMKPNIYGWWSKRVYVSICNYIYGHSRTPAPQTSRRTSGRLTPNPNPNPNPNPKPKP